MVFILHISAAYYRAHPSQKSRSCDILSRLKNVMKCALTTLLLPQAGAKSGYFGQGPFQTVLNSTSKSMPASTLGIKTGPQYVITTTVTVDGVVRQAASSLCTLSDIHLLIQGLYF